MLSTIIPTALAALALAPAALGRITNITFPATAAAGDTVSAYVTNQNYIQNWDDFGIIFGVVRNTEYACERCVGERVYYFNNFKANTTGNEYGDIIPLTHNDPYPVNFTLPESYESGKYVFVAAVPYLVGASGGTGIEYFNGTVEVTGTTSSSS